MIAITMPHMHVHVAQWVMTEDGEFLGVKVSLWSDRLIFVLIIDL